MLYQKGEKLQELKDTLKKVPELSGLKSSNFVITKEEFSRFQQSITEPFCNLHNALFSTLTTHCCNDEKRNIVKKACDHVISYLNKTYEAELVNNFYLLKLRIYDYLFFNLIYDELIKRYPEYHSELSSITDAYREMKGEHEIFDFEEISELLYDYNAICRESHKIDADVQQYVVHNMEMIAEKISELVKQVCKERYLNPDVLPNRLRKLIYLLDTNLALDLNSEEKTEE